MEENYDPGARLAMELSNFASPEEQPAEEAEAEGGEDGEEIAAEAEDIEEEGTNEN